MTKELLIASSPHETKVAVLEDDQLVEVYFQRDTDVGLAGGIYKGRVNRVLPGMQSAFVNISLERDAFLYVSDFFEDSEEYDRVFTEAENRVARLGGDAGTVASAEASALTSPEPTRAAPSGLTALPAAESAEPGARELPPSPPSGRSSITVASAPAASGQGPERIEQQRHGFSGHHRRRGRRFRDSRFPARREAEERREQQPSISSQGFHLLPGESLAKYGHGPEDAGQAPAGAHGELSANLDAAAETSFTEAQDSRALPELPSVTEGIAEVPPADEAAAAQEVLPNGPFASATPSTFEEEEEGLPELEDQGAFDRNPDEDSSVHAGGAEINATPEGEASETSAEAAGSETHGAPVAEPAAQSYTLRESEHRPRVAPQRRGRRGRGRFRPHQGRRPEAASPTEEESRPGSHHPAAISELLKEGQEILIQIAKEPLGAKGARITSHIALPGRYLVYMPTIDHIGVSRKIGSEEERLRLRSIILQHKGSLTGGFIVRTAGAGRSEEELKADLAFLTNLWNDIRAKAERTKAPALLHRDLTLVERILRDLLSPEFKSVRVDNEIEYEHVLNFVHRFQPLLVDHVKLYTRDTPLFEEFGIQAEIDKALKPKVWLKSGGYIVINQTEALVAIDVNTGKYVGKTNRLEDTIVKTNIDAVKEIVRQIRLRDLGGIIVIDFIDMDERRNRIKVVQALEEALRDDRAPTKILAFNEFGLVALTRKRVKQSLERTLCEPCPHCSGAGWIKSIATVSYDIVAEARKMAAEIDGKILNLRVHPSVAAALKSRNGVLITEIEAATGKEVVIKSDPEVHQERFEIF